MNHISIYENSCRIYCVPKLIVFTIIFMKIVVEIILSLNFFFTLFLMQNGKRERQGRTLKSSRNIEILNLI